MKIAQINAQRSAVVASELAHIIGELSIDILCIQEPYFYKGDIRGFSSLETTTFRPIVEKPWVAIVIASSDIEILHYAHLDTAHIICFQVKSEMGDFCVVNVYCQFSLPLEPIIKSVDDIIKKVNSRRIIITMDSNSKSDLWFSGETDENGKIIEDFIMANNLYILNEPNNPPTFFSVSGQSNIDITLVSENMLRNVSGWRVLENCSTSDHNMIIFDVKMENRETRKMIKEDKYNIGRADWKIFNNFLTNESMVAEITHFKNMETNKAVKEFDKILHMACEAAIPKKRKSNKSTPWWNDDLAQLRREYNRAKRALTRARRMNIVEETEISKKRYVLHRNKYTAEIKKAKKESWTNFVNLEANKDPWSIPYKIVRDKIKKTEVLTTLTKEDGSITNNFEETIEALLNKCVPPDNLLLENDNHKKIRDNINSYRNSNIEREFSVEEIGRAIKKLKNKTAPGADNFNPEIIKELWKYLPNSIVDLMNNCLGNGIFPDTWKIAKLKVILKDKNKDKRLIGSYRPISLLTSMGKILERIVVERIQEEYKASNLENENQYGFRKGKSTEDAILHLRTSVSNTSKKYVVALFIDIQGAFDNLWWPAIKARLIRANISTSIMRLINSYFKKRKAMITAKYNRYYRSMEKGCPQGSVLGPAAWNWCMDAFLNRVKYELSEEDIETVAYADDVVLIIKANSRTEIERNAVAVIRVLMEWCILHKLKISASKTFAMLVKGKLNKERNPIIKIDCDKVKFVDQVKYLGVVLDNKFTFIPHAKYIRSRLTSYIYSIKRIAKEEWGIKAHIRKTLYNTVAIPIAAYAAAAWFDKVSHTMIKRHLLAAQRSLLLIGTRATRTTSTDAMQTIAGALPMDLVIVERGLKSMVRRNVAVNWNEYFFNKKMIEEEFDIHEEYLKISLTVRESWQDRWDGGEHGRQTYKFVKNVDFAIINKWFAPCRECVYLITGYGSIGSTLYRRGAIDFKDCPACDSEDETVDHMILECPAYEHIRYEELKFYIKDCNKLINTPDSYGKFREFAQKLFQTRNTYI